MLARQRSPELGQDPFRAVGDTGEALGPATLVQQRIDVVGNTGQALGAQAFAADLFNGFIDGAGLGASGKMLFVNGFIVVAKP